MEWIQHQATCLLDAMTPSPSPGEQKGSGKPQDPTMVKATAWLPSDGKSYLIAPNWACHCMASASRPLKGVYIAGRWLRGNISSSQWIYSSCDEKATESNLRTPSLFGFLSRGHPQKSWLVTLGLLQEHTHNPPQHWPGITGKTSFALVPNPTDANTDSGNSEGIACQNFPSLILWYFNRNLLFSFFSTYIF